MTKKNKYELDNSFGGLCTECRKVEPTMVWRTRRVCVSCFLKLLRQQEKDGN